MSDESFVRRWSRLKQTRQGDAPPLAEDVPEPPAETQQDIHQLSDSDMPPVESLDESSDYSVFFSEKVSESLRRTALRKLFHQPALNVVDGLDDYAEDFTRFETLGDTITHDMRRLARSDKDADAAGPGLEPDGEAGGESPLVEERREEEAPSEASAVARENGQEDVEDG